MEVHIIFTLESFHGWWYCLSVVISSLSVYQYLSESKSVQHSRQIAISTTITLREQYRYMGNMFMACWLFCVPDIFTKQFELTGKLSFSLCIYMLSNYECKVTKKTGLFS